MVRTPQFSAGRTRRRRLLLLRSPLEQITSVDRESDQHPVSAEGVVRLSPPACEPLAVTSRLRSISELVTGEESICWLFTGDSYLAKSTEPVNCRTYTSRFAGAVRSGFDRPRDVFIDGTFPQARLSEILFDFEKRIAKFNPDVCFLSLSLQEADSKSTDRCEKMLLRLIRWAEDTQCRLVLQTPPILTSRSDLELTRRLVFVEAVRGMAAEHDLILADHWQHWEESPVATLQPSPWIDPQTSAPSDEGHRQLATRLIRDLQLSIVQAQNTESQNHEVLP